MIPWMREKFAERKAKWEASRKRNNLSENIGVSDKIPLQRDSSHDPIEIFDNESHRDCDNDVTSLNILSWDGRLESLRLLASTAVKEFKLQVLTKFKILPTVDDEVIVIRKYKLLRATEVLLELDESLSISENRLTDQDEVLLIKVIDNEIILKRDFQKGPSQSVIDNITVNRIMSGEKSFPTINIDDILLHSYTDIQNDIRQLMISLAKSSAFVIGAGPFATQIVLMFKHRLVRRNANNLYESLPRLHSQNNLNCENGSSDAWKSKTKILDLSERLSEEHFSHSLNYESTKNNIEALLEVIRIYSYKQITPETNLNEIIWNMGFSKHDVNEALKITDNNYADACKWLMRTQDNHNDGLLKDSPISPILKALLTSPLIQLSFSSPKIFIAYLSILDNYYSINLWLNDAETAGVIGHILRTYHEEKHILAINQIS